MNSSTKQDLHYGSRKGKDTYDGVNDDDYLSDSPTEEEMVI